MAVRWQYNKWLEENQAESQFQQTDTERNLKSPLPNLKGEQNRTISKDAEGSAQRELGSETRAYSTIEEKKQVQRECGINRQGV